MPSCRTCHGLQVFLPEAPNYGIEIDGVALSNGSAGEECEGCRLLCEVLRISGVEAAEIAEVHLCNMAPERPMMLQVRLHPAQGANAGSVATRRLVDLEIFTAEGHPSRWPGLGPGRPLPDSPSAQQGVQTAQGWAQKCRDTHAMCRHGAVDLPTRLIAVGHDDSSIALVQLSRGSRGEYVARSHCWGRKQPLVTKTTNIASHLRRLHHLDLPQTFRDAILVTRACGIPYLWIDSLCIVQDDPDDWARESARMTEVYALSAFTIAADAGSDSSSGLFVDSTERRSSIGNVIVPRESNNDASVNVWIRYCGEKRTTDAAHSNVTRHSPPLGSTLSPLSSRAWVLQERMMSRRTLHFTTREMAWECDMTNWCECSTTEETWLERVISFKTQYVDEPASNESSGAARQLRWLQLVEDYTRRRLTFASDRLIAISGLAKAAQSLNGMEYFAGLWSGEREFLYGLLWVAARVKEKFRHDDPSEMLIHRRLPADSAPSWSWASITGSVAFLEYASAGIAATIVPKATVESVKCSPTGLNLFGPVRDACVVVTGCVAPVALLEDAGQPWRRSTYEPTCTTYGIVSEHAVPVARLTAAVHEALANSLEVEVVRQLIDIPGLPQRLRHAPNKQHHHLCDNVAIDVNDPLDLDVEERHFFLMLGHSCKSQDEPSFYDLVEQDEILRDVVHRTRAAERHYEHDTRPCGLLLRPSRHVSGAFERVGCVVSRLKAGGWETWQLVSEARTVKIV